MILQPGIATAELTVVLDIRYPQAYLALHPAMAFARERDLRIDWLPIAVSTLKAPAAEAEEEDRGTRHRRFRAQKIANEIEVYAEAQALVLKDLYRAGDSLAFNLGWLWMRHHHGDRLEDYLRESFRSYWAVEFDPAVEAEVSVLIEALGGEGEAFRSWSRGAGRVAFDEWVDALHAQGVFAVPSYLAGGELFLGRQHLPMIDWILAGRTGQIPI